MKNNIKKSKKYRVLIIGANGFLGSNIIRVYKENNHYKEKFLLFAADLIDDNIKSDIPFSYIDITDQNNVLEKVLEISPDSIILTAAMTDVDKCEIEKELAYKINVVGPKNLIDACSRINSKLLFLSTDFIFSGENGSYHGYKEDDVPNPLSYYGLTKYKAELAIFASGIDYLICRTSVLYGWNKNKLNFITWLLKKLEKGEKISILTTQINSPTFVKNLAEILLIMIERDAQGIFHTAGDCVLNRYQIALKCADVFNLNSSLIQPVEDFKQKATRPSFAGLNIEKLKNFLGDALQIFNLKEGLRYMTKNK